MSSISGGEHGDEGEDDEDDDSCGAGVARDRCENIVVSNNVTVRILLLLAVMAKEIWLPRPVRMREGAFADYICIRNITTIPLTKLATVLKALNGNMCNRIFVVHFLLSSVKRTTNNNIIVIMWKKGGQTE